MATTVGVTTNSMLEKATLEAALANAASTQLPDEGNKNNMLHEENLSKQDDAALASSGDEQDAKEEKNSMLMSPNENKGMLMSPASGTTMMMKMSCSSPTFTESTTGVMHTNNVARADMNAEESSHASTTCTSTAHTSPNLPTEPETTMESMMEKSVEAIMEDNMQKLLMEENKKLLLNVDVAEKLEEKQTKTDGEKKVEKKAMVAKPPTQSDPSDEHVLRYQKYLDSSIRWKKVDEAWSWVDKMTSAEMPIEYQSVSALVKISLDSPDSLRQGKLRRAFSLLKRFLKRSKDAEEGLYNTCLDGFARLRDVQSMEQTLVDLRNHAYHARPGAVTYGTLIKAYGTLRDFNRVLLLWEEMRGTDIPPNAVTYGCMLDACVKCNHVEMAVTTFEDMKATNLHKNTVLYTTIIKGFAKIKDLSRAMKLYREMLAERVPCNVVTYNSLIDVAVRCNNMKVAAMVLQEMQSSGIMPDIITFSTLVKGFCNEGNLRKALLVANEARIRRLGVDEIMFNSLLDGCAKIGDFETGLLVFAEMQRCSIAPSCVTFSILVRLYSGVNRLYDAIDLVFRQMPYMWKVQPTRAVYSCLMKACAQQGDPMNVAYILGYTMKLPESQIKQLLRDAQAANPAAFETVEDRSLASSAAAAASYGFDCWGEKGAPFHEHKGGNYNSESKSGHFGKSWNSWNSERWNSEKGYGKGSHWQEGSYAGKGASQHKGASHKGSKGGHNYTEKGEGKHKKGSWGNGNHYNKGSNYNSSHNSGFFRSFEPSIKQALQYHVTSTAECCRCCECLQ
ncbi:unnamed protein product [Amoebophrya sp. A25]|nr:unnamed protein product [Amoebophrya sp. A25]|eukprot:GSA25T00018622001.1